MKKEEIELLRKNYNDLLNDKKRLISLKKKIKRYEKLDIIKEYNSMISECNELSSKYFYNDEKKSNDYFLSKAVKNTKITPTYDTYLYMGSFKRNIDRNSPCDDMLEFNDKDTEYVLFKNIELPDYSKGYLVELDLENAKEFILNHNIIYPKNTDNYGLYFYNLQLEFYKVLVNDSEEEALKLIRGKNEKEK